MYHKDVFCIVDPYFKLGQNIGEINESGFGLFQQGRQWIYASSCLATVDTRISRVFIIVELIDFPHFKCKLGIRFLNFESLTHRLRFIL
jgi:hypothetical protein